MALNGNDLGQAVYDTIDVSGFNQAEKNNLLASWQGIGTAIVDYLVANTELDDAKLIQGLNSVFTTGTPLPNDGGSTLQATWSSATSGGAKDAVQGGIK